MLGKSGYVFWSVFLLVWFLLVCDIASEILNSMSMHENM